MLSASDVVALPLLSSSVVHTTGVTMAISDSARGAAEKAADLVESVGARLSFDIDHRPGLISPADAAELYLTMVRRAQVVFGSLDEFRLLLGGTPSVDEVIAAVLALGPKEVIIKQGKDGATTGAIEGTMGCRGPPGSVIDRIGAGDAFVAGYLSRRIRGGPIETALEMANSRCADLHGRGRVGGRADAAGRRAARERHPGRALSEASAVRRQSRTRRRPSRSDRP